MPRPPQNLLPEEFVTRLTRMCGNNDPREVFKTFVERPTTFRANTLRASVDFVSESLTRERLRTRPIPWSKGSFLLIEERARALQKSKLFSDGHIYLQSLASMVPPLVLAPRPGESILDLTAAPGSKTSQIAALMDRTGSLVAVEKDPIRFQRLAHNMKLLGVKAEDEHDSFLTLVHGDGAAYCTTTQQQFDRILVDAPCSAEARFIAEDRRTFGYWGLKSVREMAAQQMRLLLAAWPRLKPGGTLVYSTCTFAPEENEIQISKLLEAFPGECRVVPARTVPIKYMPILTQWEGERISAACEPCARVLPTKEIEGFFVAKLVKVGRSK